VRSMIAIMVVIGLVVVVVVVVLIARSGKLIWIRAL